MATGLALAVLLLCPAAASDLAVCGPESRVSPASLSRFEYSQVAMGVRARIVLYACGEAQAKRACEAAFDRVVFLEDVMSDYLPNSELMRLCANAEGPPVRVSPELLFVLTKAQELSRRSSGAFDVTIGPLVKLWREARNTGKLPSKEQLDAARKLVGWPKVEINAEARTVRLAVPGMKLDLGGIAKGYACDEAIRVLKHYGVASAMVEMGGDIVVSGPPPGKRGWVIEIPNADQAHRRLTLVNAAVSSSGDTEQYVEIGGKRYSHIVDPRTGLGLTNRIAATVVAPSGITSDALSTAVSVLGPTKGYRLVRLYRNCRLYVRSAGGE